MPAPDVDVIKGMLQTLEHTLDASNQVAGLCRHLLNAQRDRTSIVPYALQRYEAQLSELTTQRERMRGIVAKWWTLMEESH
jgi:hypothetical protein